MEDTTTKELEQLNKVLLNGKADNDSLLGGNLGLAFYFYQLYKVTEDVAYQQRGFSLLQEVFVNLNKGEPTLTGAAFSNGGAGLIYVVNQLVQENLLNIDMDTELAALDNYLFNTALTDIDNDFIDCLHGAFGIIHSFCERPVNSKANEYLNILVEKICNKAVKDPHGLWFKNYVIDVNDKKEINFSLSHGLSGMLIILINCYDACGHKELIKQTVADGVRFIFKHRMDIDFSRDEYSFFPFTVDPAANEIFNKPRLAWCYGDLNQVLLLLRAGKLCGNDYWIRLGNLIGLSALMRKDEKSTRVSDAHFCHGAAGLAQFFKVIYQESGNEKFLVGYNYWVAQTIYFLKNDIEKNTFKGKEYDLLNGLVGIALVLLNQATDKPLSWSKVLFL